MANRSTFPTSIDSFIENTEINASDIPLLARYQELKLKTNRTPAENDELATLTSGQLRTKLMTAEDYNQMKDAIKNTQSFFRDSVDGYVQTKQSEFQAEIDKFSFKGEYNPSTQYKKKNTISYQGESYLCLQDCINQLPNPLSNTTYWAKIAQKGAKGDQGVPGVGLRNSGSWSASKQYYVDDAVQYGGQIFACIQDNIGIEPNPDKDTAYWTLAIARGVSTKVTAFENTIVVNNSTTNVPIGIPEYNSTSDILTVVKNSTVLVKGLNYNLNRNATSIDSINEVWDGTEQPIYFHFIVYKNFVADVKFGDGTLIQDGTVAKSKLDVYLRDELDSKLKESEFYNHKADVTAHNTYTTCATAAATTEKSVAVSGFTLSAGARITVKFTNANSATTPMLNVNSSGAKPLLKPDGTVFKNIKAGVYSFVYDGSGFIVQGEGASGNAAASDLLSGKTASTDVGEITGSMPIIGAITITPATIDQAIPDGYHNGSGKVLGDANLIPMNIRKGVNIFGFIGSAMAVNPGDTVINSNLFQRAITSTSFTKAKETRVGKGGAYRVSYNIFTSNAGNPYTSVIRVNGVDVGTFRTGSNTTPIKYTEDISVNDGDFIQVFVKGNTTGQIYVDTLTLGLDLTFTQSTNF